MSYDIDIEGSEEHFNITFNVGQVWRDFLDPEGIKVLHGKTGAEACEMLHQFWKRIDNVHMKRYFLKPSLFEADAAFRKDYDASNGWGTLTGALIFTGRLHAECAKFPNSRISVWS